MLKANFIKILDYINPEAVFDIVANKTGTIFLDSNSNHKTYAQYSYILINPIKNFVASKNSFVTDLNIWQELLANNYKTYSNLPPFQGGIAGYISYDLAKSLEDIPSNNVNNIPDYILNLYNQVIAFDHKNNKCYLYVIPIDNYHENHENVLENLYKIYLAASNKKSQIVTNKKCHKIELNSNFTRDKYHDAVKKAISYIREGDIFEVNISQCFRGNIPNNFEPNQLYKKLRSSNPAPFSGYLNLGKLKILSSSPERFIKVTDSKIEAHPIKGTIKRSTDPNQDINLANELINSEKNRAENIMIVDLMRNDLSKICTANSIEVENLCKLETFTNVHHLVSTITGSLKANCNVLDIIEASFPGGSITGAPKIRAMQIIEELEDQARGVYCGSIGYFSFNKNVDLSIAIRTIVINEDQIQFNVGGAITLDSDPESEYQETLLKGQKLHEAINDFSY